MRPPLQKNSFAGLPKGENTPTSSNVGSPSDEEIKFTAQTNKLDKPKRNRSAFIIFSSDMRAKIAAEAEKKLNSNEMMIKLADLWKNLKEEERRRYFDMADKEKVKYLVELNEFYQTHPYEVIQNRTKKNHVKKPCSAYGLFLKDSKQTVKAENPELKMADVLKVIAEKWKNLNESQRKTYQEQAQAEKKMIKEKQSEQASTLEDEQNTQVFLPQKRLQSQKRVKKALLKEEMKQKMSSPEDTKATATESSVSSPFEEAVFVTEKEFQRNESIQSFIEVRNDNFDLMDLPLLTFNSGRAPSIESIFESTRPNSFEDHREIRPKKTGELLVDLLSFHTTQKTFDGSYYPQSPMNVKTPFNCIDFNTPSVESSRKVLNESLLKALSFEPSNESFLESLRFDRSANGAEL